MNNIQPTVNIIIKIDEKTKKDLFIIGDLISKL